MSLYQCELDGLKGEFYGRDKLAKEVEMESFFENRLNKIRSYNEGLCSKIAQAKVIRRSPPLLL